MFVCSSCSSQGRRSLVAAAGQPAPQLTAFFTSAPIFASSAAVDRGDGLGRFLRVLLFAHRSLSLLSRSAAAHLFGTKSVIRIVHHDRPERPPAIVLCNT